MTLHVLYTLSTTLVIYHFGDFKLRTHAKRSQYKGQNAPRARAQEHFQFLNFRSQTKINKLRRWIMEPG